MLLVLAVGFRTIAFVILWARGHRKSMRMNKFLLKIKYFFKTF